MAWEVFTDRNVLLCWYVAGIAALLSVTLAPWLMGRSIRRRSLPHSSALRLIAACFFLGVAVPIAMLTFLALVDPVFLFPGLAGVALVFAVVAKRPRLPVWGGHLGVILLCSLVYMGAFSVGLGRVRTLSMRTVDGATLNAMGMGLLTYREQHGVFPEDLRQLVDARLLGPYSLLPVLSDTDISGDHSDTEPYRGPCEFVYTRLPHDAPEGLVWVWESPEYHGGEGAWVLYSWGRVRWVTPEKLHEDVEQTEAWLRTARRRPLATPCSTTSIAD